MHTRADSVLRRSLTEFVRTVDARPVPAPHPADPVLGMLPSRSDAPRLLPAMT
jgi:hypothetical protein